MSDVQLDAARTCELSLASGYVISRCTTALSAARAEGRSESTPAPPRRTCDEKELPERGTGRKSASSHFSFVPCPEICVYPLCIVCIVVRDPPPSTWSTLECDL